MIVENYSNIWRNLQELKEEIKGLDDESLVEEILFLNFTKSNSVVTTLNEFLKKGSISVEQRIELENCYILMYLED